MRTKVTLVLVFLNVALFFFIFKFERNWRTERASLEARRRVLGPESADIRSLEIVGATPATSFSLARTGETWSLTHPIAWPANPHAADSIVKALQFLEHEASFTVADLARNGQSLADFGLENPRMRVTFQAGELDANKMPAASVTLQIGDTTGNRLYILSPDKERVQVVDRTLADSLSKPISQLRADTLLTIEVFEARSLTIQTGSGEQRSSGTAGVRVRLRRDNARWSFEAPISARGSKMAIDRAIKDLNMLRAKNFNPPNPPTPLPIDAPTLRIGLEGNNRRENLFLGEKVPPSPGTSTGGAAAPGAKPPVASDPNAVAEVEYYAQLEGRNALFTVAMPTALLEALRNAQDILRERRILVDFDSRAVSAITLMAPNASPLTLQRLETSVNGPNASGWQIIRRGEGGQGPQTLAADTGAVERLLTQLALLSAERFQSDAPTSADQENWGFNRPEREVTLTVAGAPMPIVLQLGTAPSRELYARLTSPSPASFSVYEVRRDILDELPVAPTSWRARLLRELPASAQITALKLTELPTQKALLEVAFNAAGEPVTPVRDLEAVKELIAQIRTLRAKKFVQDSFTDRITAAGDERTWKYQLDATVVLPGGTGPEQASLKTLFFTDRLGGAQQLAGSKEFEAIFEVEQPLLDALWRLIYGPRDPGPPVPAATKK